MTFTLNRRARVRSAGPIAVALMLGGMSACGGSGGATQATPSTRHRATTLMSTSAPRSSVAVATTTTTLVEPGAWEEAGRSVEGRPIRMRKVGHGERTVLWVGGIHGDEPEGAVATAELADAFVAAGLAEKAALLIIEDLNPDGRLADTRGNANDVDLNRNFPAANFDSTDPRYGGSPLSQPEARVLHDVVIANDPDLVLVAHGWRGATFVNFDGPAEQIALAFSQSSGMPVEYSDALADPTPGSLGSWIGIERGTAILTIEYLRGSDPTENWERSRAAILGAIAG